MKQAIARALTGMCAAGLAAILAAACSSPRHPSAQDGTPPEPSTTSTDPGQATTEPTPSTGEGTGKTGGPVGRACAAADLTLAQLPGGDAAGGTVIAPIGLTNKSGRACSLNGYPEFTLTGAGNNLPLAIQHGGINMPTFTAPPTAVTLNASGKAGFLVAYLNRPKDPSGSCGAATTMRLTVGGAAVSGPVQLSVCGEPFKVSPYVSPAQLSST